MCRDLGANIFNYFVLHDFKDIDIMMCILLEEIIESPLQYIFEFTISLAIQNYQHGQGAVPLKLEKSRQYKLKLMRKDSELGIVLREGL